MDVILHLVREYEAKNLGSDDNSEETVEKRAEMTAMYLIHLTETQQKMIDMNEEERILGHTTTTSIEFDE